MDIRLLVPIVILVGILVAVMVAFTMRRRGNEQPKRHEQAKQQPSESEQGRTAPAVLTLLKQRDDAGSAEAVPAEPEKHTEAFPLRALSPVDREAYTMEWAAIEFRFVDNPSAAVGSADRLLSRAMTDRGYPMTGFDERAADIAVSYPTVVHNYRAAHQIALRQIDGHATVEELRQAMGHYRSLFEELLEPRVEPAPSKVQPINGKRGGVARAS